MTLAVNFSWFVKHKVRSESTQKNQNSEIYLAMILGKHINTNVEFYIQFSILETKHSQHSLLKKETNVI